jgi:isopentenyl-diphosphate delta-isomerase
LAESATQRVVSFDSEQLVVVDEHDRVIGHATKSACHDGQGLLHRAFSLFVFDSAGHLLLQQRSRNKRLWPGYWSNSCCSHPRRGESMEEAIQRRLSEELGFNCPLRFLYKFEYRAAFGSEGTEHELCSVYAGSMDSALRPNENEIAACRWVAPKEFDHEIAREPERFTPWLRMEWRRLREDFGELFAGPKALFAGSVHTRPQKD